MSTAAPRETLATCLRSVRPSIRATSRRARPSASRRSLVRTMSWVSRLKMEVPPGGLAAADDRADDQADAEGDADGGEWVFNDLLLEGIGHFHAALLGGVHGARHALPGGAEEVAGEARDVLAELGEVVAELGHVVLDRAFIAHFAGIDGAHGVVSFRWSVVSPSLLVLMRSTSQRGETGFRRGAGCARSGGSTSSGGVTAPS